jgi:hypothetical protein
MNLHEIVAQRAKARAMEKRIRTGFIGALARFEDYFGTLWGHDKPPEQRTLQENLWYDVWLQCRNEVLNNGNKQIRDLYYTRKEQDEKGIQGQD